MLEIISSLDKRFGDEGGIVFEVQVEFIEGRHPKFSEKVIYILKTHIDQAPSIQDNFCFRYTKTEYRSVIPENGVILLGSILVIALTHMWSVALLFKNQDLLF